MRSDGGERQLPTAILQLDSEWKASRLTFSRSEAGIVVELELARGEERKRLRFDNPTPLPDAEDVFRDLQRIEVFAGKGFPLGERPEGIEVSYRIGGEWSCFDADCLAIDGLPPEFSI
jgi:hypothetical protein